MTATTYGRFKPQLNMPEVIALSQGQGKFMPSRPSTIPGAKPMPDSVMFTLVDDRKWFVDPYVADRIEKLGIGANQKFTVCMREKMEGNRRMVDYEIGAVSHTAPTQPTAYAQTAAFGDQSNSPQYNARAHQIAAELAAEMAKPSHVTPGRVFLPAPEDQPPRETKREEPLAIRVGREAIEAVLAVSSYARQKGMTDFEFGTEDIRALWLTLLINATKGGAR